MNLNLTSAVNEQSFEWAGDDTTLLFTVSKLDGLMDSRYRAYLSRMQNWFAEVTGESMAGMDDWSDDDSLRFAPVLNYAVEVAQNMASLYSLKRLIKRGGEDTGDTWEQVRVPAEWESFDGYRANIPAELSLRWNIAAHLVNPLLWSMPDDPDNKKKEQGSEKK